MIPCRFVIDSGNLRHQTFWSGRARALRGYLSELCEHLQHHNSQIPIVNTRMAFTRPAAKRHSTQPIRYVEEVDVLWRSATARLTKSDFVSGVRIFGSRPNAECVGHVPFAPVGRLHPDSGRLAAQHDGWLPFVFAPIGKDDLNTVAGGVLIGYPLGHARSGRARDLPLADSALAVAAAVTLAAAFLVDER